MIYKLPGCECRIKINKHKVIVGIKPDSRCPLHYAARTLLPRPSVVEPEEAPVTAEARNEYGK